MQTYANYAPQPTDYEISQDHSEEERNSAPVSLKAAMLEYYSLCQPTCK